LCHGTAGRICGENSSRDPRGEPSAHRLRALPVQKLVLFVVLNLWVAGPYYALQHWVCFAVTPMPETALDRLIPFSEGAVWLYLGVFLWLPVPPLFEVSRAELG